MTITQLIKNVRKFGLSVAFNRYYSIYRGIVTDVEDPLKLGRIKIKLPQFMEGKELPDWAFPFAMFAGDKHGFINIPEVGDYVWMQFEEGDINKPVWTPGHFATNEMPDGVYDGKKPVNKVFVTKGGNTIVLSDKSGKEAIMLKDKLGNVIIINNKGVSIANAAGITLKSCVADLKTSISAMTVATALGPSSPPINIAQFLAAFEKFDTVLGDVTEL